MLTCAIETVKFSSEVWSGRGGGTGHQSPKGVEKASKNHANVVTLICVVFGLARRQQNQIHNFVKLYDVFKITLKMRKLKNGY